jgi:hypothetical protein
MPGRWAVALLVVSLGGCWCPVAPTPDPSTLTRASGARDVLLRMSVGGGLPNPALTFEDPPRFTLYGDGRIIHTVAHESDDGTFTSEQRLAQLPEDRLGALLALALGPGGLATAKDSYRDVEVFDAVTTIFEIHAGGTDKTVFVYALGLADETAPSRCDRTAFKGLQGRIDEAAAEAADLGPFEPTAYRVTIATPFGDAEPNADWPWPDLRPTDFEPAGGPNRVRIVNAEQGAIVTNLGITHDLIMTAPDGDNYMIRIRPLLPDEVPDEAP